MNKLFAFLGILMAIGCNKASIPNDSINYKGLVKDFDNNVYDTIVLGNQVWTTENLKTRHYNNGNSIDSFIWTTNYTQAISLELHADTTHSGGWMHFEYGGGALDSNDNILGLLYNYYTIIDSRGIAPKLIDSLGDKIDEGWHIPTDADWNTLINYAPSNSNSLEDSAIINSPGYLDPYIDLTSYDRNNINYPSIWSSSASCLEIVRSYNTITGVSLQSTDPRGYAFVHDGCWVRFVRNK